ncbi:MAG: hypothetical protein KBS78_05815 [Bacteroidales bacterium]|nr:hypothetical protein [Candidatus Cryptobacteroides faecihippi]
MLLLLWVVVLRFWVVPEVAVEELLEGEVAAELLLEELEEVLFWELLTVLGEEDLLAELLLLWVEVLRLAVAAGADAEELLETDEPAEELLVEEDDDEAEELLEVDAEELLLAEPEEFLVCAYVSALKATMVAAATVASESLIMFFISNRF